MVKNDPEMEPVAAEEVPVTILNNEDVVAYMMAGWRVIQAADWADVGVPDGKDRVWASDNNREIPVSEFSEAELAWLLAQEDEFIMRPATPTVAPELEVTVDPAQHY